MRHFVRQLRLKFMPVIVGPQYFGFVLYKRELLPDCEALPALRWAAAFLSLGPLLWSATLLLNDVCDLEQDRVNPRKAGSPLVSGNVSRAAVLRTAIAMLVSALVLSALVSPGFFVMAVSCSVLAVLYSVRPFRLKERPGFDVFVNALGIGVLCPLAGWSIEAPIHAFPWPFLLPLVTGFIGFYIPTTMMDASADRESGGTSFAVRFGFCISRGTSLAAIVVCNLSVLVFALFGYVITPRLFACMAPIVIFQVLVLLVSLRREDRPDVIWRGTYIAAMAGLAAEVVFILYLVGAIL
ncbi:UbiA prenyltransferase family protein [Thermodesulfobacteriota bacterium]